MSPQGKYTAVILAASRRGKEDTVAKIQNLSHKCLVVIDEMVMLERVVREVVGTPEVGRVYVSIESTEILDSVPALKEMREAGTIHYLPSEDNLYLSVANAAKQIENPWPLIFTTGDNALHTSEMVSHFCNEMEGKDLDAAAAMTPSAVILEAYPNGKRAFHNLKGESWSSCNLYAVLTEKALGAAKIFEGGGQFGKKPERLLKAFGLIFLILYKFKLATIDGLAKRLSTRWKIAVKIVNMPYADAPSDVDNPGDFERTERILKARRGIGEAY